MSTGPITADEYLKKELEKKVKKNIQLRFYRRRCKKKKSLISNMSISSTSSIISANSENKVEGPAVCRSDSLEISLNTPMIMADIATDLSSEPCPSDTSSTSDDVDLIDDPTSTMPLEEEELNNDVFSELDMESHELDHRPLHPFTRSTVNEFSIDVIDFCRGSRLPKNQRSHLLDLFRKYLPSPNLVPTSSEDLSGKCYEIQQCENLPRRNAIIGEVRILLCLYVLHDRFYWFGKDAHY